MRPDFNLEKTHPVSSLQELDKMWLLGVMCCWMSLGVMVPTAAVNERPIIGKLSFCVLAARKKYSCFSRNNLSPCMRKPTICICKNKDADQLRGNLEAAQCLLFSLHLLFKSKISSF